MRDEVTSDNGEEVINRIKNLKEIGVVQLEDFDQPDRQVCVRIDKERVHESYRANCNTNDKVYT